MLPHEKQCLYCKSIKPIEDFYKNKNRHNGFAGYCKSCSKIYYQSYKDKLRKRETVAIPDSKQCKNCQDLLPASAFARARTRKDGLQDNCKNCQRLYRESRIGTREKLYYMMKGARSRSKKNGLEYDLDLEWLLTQFESQQACPILGIRLDWHSRKLSKASPTLDRFDPTKGYIKTNVWVISSLANAMKANSSLEEQVKFANYIYTYILPLLKDHY